MKRTDQQVKVRIHPEDVLTGGKRKSKVWQTVQASVRAGLAIHLTLQPDERKTTAYTVTHVPTGMAIGMTETEQQARDVCDLLEGVTDWEKVTDHGPELRGCYQLVEAIFAEIVGKFVRCGG
jgi:hypothetical protein